MSSETSQHNDGDIAVPERFLAHVYLSDGPREEAERLTERVADFLMLYGYEFETGWEIRQGSWIAAATAFLSKAAELINFKRVQDSVITLLGGQPQGMSSESGADMAARLIEALDGKANSAVIDAGCMMFMKVPDGDGGHSIVAKRLTRSDRETIDRHPELLTDPEAMLHKLGFDARVRHNLERPQLAATKMQSALEQLETAKQQANTSGDAAQHFRARPRGMSPAG